MNIRDLDAALVEVERFKVAARALKKTLPSHGKGKPAYAWHVVASPEGGAVRRASMDLTRVLAKLRKGRVFDG